MWHVGSQVQELKKLVIQNKEALVILPFEISIKLIKLCHDSRDIAKFIECQGKHVKPKLFDF